jgi:hypothetical protein
MEEKGPRQTSWPIFVTHHTGLPFHGSPLIVLPPQFLHRARISRPHPVGKGRGGCGCGPFRVCWGVGVQAHITHKRGGARRWAVACCWEGAVVLRTDGGGGGMRAISTVMRLMSL